MPVHEYRHEFEHVSLMLITGTMMQYELLCLFYLEILYTSGTQYFDALVLKLVR